MDKYYYFIAQSQRCFSGKSRRFPLTRFMNEAEKWLDPDDYEILCSLDLQSIAVNRGELPILKDTKNLKMISRTDIAAFREARVKTSNTSLRAFRFQRSRRVIP
jgi:hypothetical protein